MNMNVSVDFPSFEKVEEALSRARSSSSAAEAHGLLSGILCARAKKSKSSLPIPLLTEISGLDVNLAPHDKETLVSLYEHTSSQLDDLAFGFQLLLPEDDKPLSLRARSLSQWCQGFLTGLGLGDLQSALVKKSTNVYDALLRLSEIAKLDHDRIVATEADEAAYIEVVEYVRLAVMVIYEEVIEVKLSKRKQKTKLETTIH